jgi:hypothetical protein
MVKESLRPCEFGGHPGGSAGLDRFPGLAGAFGTKTRAGQVETIQVAEADGAGFGADRRRSFSQGAGRARPAILAVHHLALVINARGRPIAKTLPLGSVGYETATNEKGEL